MQINSTAFTAVPPEQVGITSASVINLLEEIERRKINLHSLMIIRHGLVPVQLWCPPFSAELSHHQYSFSKSVLSAAVAIACAEGRIKLTDPVSRYFPRKIKQDADLRMYGVTIEHLLTMTSGAFSQNEAGVGGQYDWVEWFLNTPLSSEPGRRFIYNSMNSYIISAILRRATGEGLVDYLMPRLFEPLGIERPVWDKCPMGIECGGWGLYLKTEDMAKFCLLCLNDGVWNGRRLLPEGWAASAGASHTDGTLQDSKLDDSIHRTCGYGYHFWRNGDGVSWRADGMFGQYGIILPHKDMVIITTAGHPRQMELLEVLFDTFVPLIDSIPENTVPGGDYFALEALLERLGGGNISAPAAGGALSDLAGKMYRLEDNRHGLLPMAVKYLHRSVTLGVRTLGFEQSEYGLDLLWEEDGTTHRLPLSPSGEWSSCRLTVCGREYDAAVRWMRQEQDTLETEICFLRSAHTRRITLRFEGEELLCSFDEEPTLEDTLRILLDLAPPVRPMARRLARFAALFIPDVKGTEVQNDNSDI